MIKPKVIDFEKIRMGAEIDLNRPNLREDILAALRSEELPQGKGNLFHATAQPDGEIKLNCLCAEGVILKRVFNAPIELVSTQDYDEGGVFAFKVEDYYIVPGGYIDNLPMIGGETTKDGGQTIHELNDSHYISMTFKEIADEIEKDPNWPVKAGG